MKPLFVAFTALFLMTSCFDNKPLESSAQIPPDSICHYYSIELNEADSIVRIHFVSWPIADRDKQLLLPPVDNVKINGQILNLENNSYKLNIPIQNIKNDLITISYFKSDTVFYEKRIKLARFDSCKVIFNKGMEDDISVYFEPALNTFEELDIELKGEKTIHKRLSYDEVIQNGISFKKNMAQNSGIKNSRLPTIRLQKLYTEKYTAPASIEIRTITEIEKEIKDTPNYY